MRGNKVPSHFTLILQTFRIFELSNSLNPHFLCDFRNLLRNFPNLDDWRTSEYAYKDGKLIFRVRTRLNTIKRYLLSKFSFCGISYVCIWVCFELLHASGVRISSWWLTLDVIFVSVASNSTGAAFFLWIFFKYPLKCTPRMFFGYLCTFYRNLGNFQIPVTSCNSVVALPVTFFGGAYVAPRASLVL